MTNNRINWMICAMICAVIFAGCGGSGSGSKSGLKKNEYLGNLPAIEADSKLAEKADKEKMEKAKLTGDLGKMMKASTEVEKEKKLRYEKYKVDIEAETQKFAGKEIPVSYSKAFLEETPYEIASVTLMSGGCLGFIVKAKEDFTVAAYKNLEECYFKSVAKDGSKIDKASIILSHQFSSSNTNYTKGHVLRDKSIGVYLGISRDPEKWVNFAGIEFITQKEYYDEK